MKTEPSRIGLRVDAQHNRDRILEVAADAFAELGLDVPMIEIARRAEVGVATLYRRFPTKSALVHEVFADQLTTCAAAVDDGLADPDPWRGFCSVIEKICAMQVADRGFTAVFLSTFPEREANVAERARAERQFAELVRRAKEAGKLRRDFAHSDLTLLIMANNGVAGSAGEAAAAASRRLVGYLLQSFRAEQAQPLPAPAPINLQDLFCRS
ncbi:TetR/AcrR family transcriptional regulator [Saccharothrix coeruleofusca]|uniref:TetR/AcrR family transcriptional regulator n=1 Tax=Saccharothrix coeruleofusca TaxID=33919 RepID=UPI001E52F75D|nr:TetR/AcrR family transcriptional regulator [Saccharothrix coeruleofusca]